MNPSPSVSLLNPILFHYFSKPLAYSQSLLLQQAILSRRLKARKSLSLLSLSPTPSCSSSSSTGDNTAASTSSLERTARTDLLLLLQHEPVYTTGRRMTESIAAQQEGIRLRRETGAEWVASKRGGEVTFHGRGQLVGYCSMDLALSKYTTREYVETLEQFLRSLVASYDIPILSPSPHTGVFTSLQSKIGSIGIHLQHRLTLHGFSVNVTNEPLSYFDRIVVCGLKDVRATSMQSELAHLSQTSGKDDIDVENVADRAAKMMGTQFGREMLRIGEGEEHKEWRDLIQMAVDGKLVEQLEEVEKQKVI